MGFFHDIYLVKWYIVAGLLAILTWMLRSWFTRDELVAWKDSTREFAKKVLPLLLSCS